ncbi:MULTISPECIES: DUF2523 family protein [unclassified Undibacterium]|uniref:DUF2523 family protein n=1 Tax=unclassified Undibacterium TaxID=2630295 RepID=UPI002AC9AE0B|nr:MULTISPECIES: DUF2523 family protein [unclassified Undibacterium]MEB0137647.1 DUF2523 family protein [Undibacterium sp. CCC2.1]MEB0170648.1 DUF2523 family protein [Undibacterium sp. CCC1.1]MEB0174589.1 DUF2523 family protein [Undibacterium sp. CCC3.4]MEB0213613.1 DUF2523 family protein [Undibacterium sp. 5I2]WPX43781.1 DUF2523 family protein [Undibacterium sp. CCC3.4]
MFGIVLSVFNTALAWLVRSVLVKFVVFFGLYFITTEFVSVITNLLPSSSSLNGALSSIAANTAYFLDVFALQAGLSLVVSAYATRFLIRRLPIIG